MKIALDTLWQSIIRTIVPLAVGNVLAFVIGLGITVDAEFESALSHVLTLVLAGIYYVAIRLFERYVSPKFGWLLGVAQQPVAYVKSEVPETNVHTDKVVLSDDTAQIVVHQSK